MEKIAQIKNNENIIEQKDNMFGISLDEKRQRYIVRLMIVDGKPVVQKEFSYKGKNNQGEALQKAMKFRDEKCCDLLIPCERKREGIKLRNNQTGVVGVYRRGGGGGYVATWYDKDGKLQRAQFSENKWGHKEAFFMAWATRLLREKIFKKNKETKIRLVEPSQCVNLVHNEIGQEAAEKIWGEEQKRIKT